MMEVRHRAELADGGSRSVLVAARDLGGALSALAASVPDPEAGLFGPDSVTWRISREASVFLGSVPAIMLQLAHPWVTAAIVDHSPVVADPVGRFHRTFGIYHVMQFGTLDQALAAARRLYRRHVAVHGTMRETVGPFPAGSPYRANDADALRWVDATLVDTGLRVHERVHGPLPRPERDRFWVESRRLAGLFAIPDADLPADWDGFAAYVAAMHRSPVLTVGGDARAIIDGLFRYGRRWARMPGWYAAVAASLLPDRLREGFGLPYGPRQRATADRIFALVRTTLPLLPDRLRYVGPYQEARARLAGTPRPDLGVRLANRFWIGRPAM
jgi:uncharacterized protein (DUF2236 family)